MVNVRIVAMMTMAMVVQAVQIQMELAHRNSRGSNVVILATDHVDDSNDDDKLHTAEMVLTAVELEKDIWRSVCKGLRKKLF